MKNFLAVLQKYAIFSGRARRTEYWYFLLVYLFFLLASSFIDALAGLYNKELGLGLFSGMVLFGLLIPSVSVTVRRLHDTGRSGWWYLVVLVPVLGAIVLFFFAAQNSQLGDNAFGPNPNGISG